MLEIDGSYGEGGGQLLRLAVALAAITGTRVCITSIRARRDKPGLAPQHLTGVQAVGQLCGAKIEGLTPRSQQISFEPAMLRGGDYRFDVGTAGSITLVLQALLPVMLAAQMPCKVHITGGTDIRQAPRRGLSARGAYPADRAARCTSNHAGAAARLLSTWRR